MRDLEIIKGVWIQKQLSIAAQAIFTDDDLSFTYVSKKEDEPSTSQKGVSSDLSVGKGLEQPIDERDEPQVRHCCGDLQGLHAVGGLDISFAKSPSDEAVATLVVLSLPDLKILHEISHKVRMAEPYIPSFLAMREADHLVGLIDELRSVPNVTFPQVFLIDGNGRLHERQAGLATVVGVMADVPTIGCAKDYCPLTTRTSQRSDSDSGTHWRLSQKGFKQKMRAVLRERGDWVGINDGLGSDDKGGALLTSPDRKATNPVYVSSGHKIALDTSLAVVLACSCSGRVPEPVRQADGVSRTQTRAL